MLRSGLTLLDAMETLIEQAPGRATQALWADVSHAVAGGMPLGDALEGRPAFPHVVRQLVRVAEESGNLDVVLYRCAEMMERKRLLKTSTISALAYPVITVLAAAGVTIYMILGVIPQMKKFLTALGRKLPPMTQSLIDLSVFIQDYGLPILAGTAVFAVAAVFFYLSPPGRMQVDTWLLRIPIIGPVLRIGATALLSRAMSLLLQSGVTLLESLRTVETLHTNRRLGKLLADTRNRIIDGESLAPTLAAKGAYTPMLSKMAAVGETSGSLDDVLEQVAIFHEAQLQAQIRRLSALVEPAVIILVGGIVGYVYLAFFVALFAAAGPTK
jgi:type IV pilus assembly protein PilC